MRKAGSFWLLLVVTMLAPIALVAPASAASANLSQSYAASGKVPAGSLVSLDATHQNTVVLANTANASQLVGVAVNASDSLVASDPSSASGKVQVAIAGQASVLVSTVDGDIHTGDQIGISPFDGIGIKALADSRVIGVAETDFNAPSSGATSQTVTDKNHRSSSITVGYAEVNIAIGSNATAGGTNVNVLQKAAAALTGHTVSTIRIVLSLVIATIALLVLVTLIYASIYGSIIAIGRNPLAKYTIFRSLRAVLGLAIVAAFITGLTIYFLLT